MPLYEYECRSCGLHVDLLRPIAQRDLSVTCESCLSVHSARVVVVPFFNPHHALPVPEAIPPPSQPITSWGTITNSSIVGADTGMVIGPGVAVSVDGLNFENNRVDIDNAGQITGRRIRHGRRREESGRER